MQQKTELTKKCVYQNYQER